MAHLAARRERDRLLGATTSGPHRDALLVRPGGKGLLALRLDGAAAAVRACSSRGAGAVPRGTDGTQAGPAPVTTCSWSSTRRRRGPSSPGSRRTSRRSSPFSPTRAGRSFRTPTPWCSTVEEGDFPFRGSIDEEGRRSAAGVPAGEGVAGRQSVRAALLGSGSRSPGRPWPATSRLVDVHNGILMVEVDHPGWLQMLRLRQEALLEAARKAAPRRAVEGIRVRLGGRDSADH